MGTSLRVHGLQTMVREFAKAVHSRDGKVIFVNLSQPAESAWKDVIDYWVEMNCDTWARDKFINKQTQLPFKLGKKPSLQKSLTLEDKENMKTPTSGRYASKKMGSQLRSPHKALPTPPPSGRGALSDVTPASDRRRRSAEMAAGGVDDAIVLNTPNTPNTPRKRRKRGKFEIWEDQGSLGSVEIADSYDELSDGLSNTPSRRGRKRKLALQT